MNNDKTINLCASPLRPSPTPRLRKIRKRLVVPPSDRVLRSHMPAVWPSRRH